MRRFQDIQTTDNNLKNSFINYFFEKNYQSAFNLINQNPQLDNKAFLADCVNDIAEILYAVENSVYEGTTGKLEELSNSFNEIINQFLNKNNYDSTTIYELYNFVIYDDEVYMYINQTSSEGHLPTEETYWLKIGLRGEKGAGGCSQLQMKFEWQDDVTYQPFDLVLTTAQETTNTGAMWVAKSTNINQFPTDDSIYWEKFIEIKKEFIRTLDNQGLDTQPSDVDVGTIWFDAFPWEYSITESKIGYEEVALGTIEEEVFADIIKIGGRTVLFNQMIDDEMALGEQSGITFTRSYSSIVLNGFTAQSFNRQISPVNTIVGHTYLLFSNTQLSSNLYFWNDGGGLTTYNATMAYAKATLENPIYIKIEENSGFFNTPIQVYCIDITKMFGEGNEPDINDERLEWVKQYARATSSFNEGQLLNANVTSINITNNNLLPPSSIPTQEKNGITLTNNNDGTYSLKGTATEFTIFQLYPDGEFVPEGKYYFGCVNSRITQASIQMNVDGEYHTFDGSVVDIDGRIAGIEIDIVPRKVIDVTLKPYLAKGDSFIPYSPYYQKSIAIPSEIRNLDGYGWSAGNLYNEVQLLSQRLMPKRYVQFVGAEDLGNLVWSNASTEWNIYTTTLDNIAIGTTNLVAPIYDFTSYTDFENRPDKSICEHNGSIQIRDTSINSVSQLISKLSGKIFCYELSQPNITILSTLLDDRFKEIEAKSGSTITFYQDEITKIEIPNSIKYTIKEE